jgi:hypothetical protein
MISRKFENVRLTAVQQTAHVYIMTTDPVPFAYFLSHSLHSRPPFTCYVTPPAVRSTLIPHFQRPEATSSVCVSVGGPAQKPDNTQ